MQRKPRIFVVGSFVMDVIATTERIPPSGQTVYGKEFHMAPGGKGANQALQCARLGAEVIFQDTHVSGHACQEEIKLIYSLVKPQYAIPVHGEYKHLKAQARLAMELGVPKENVFIISSGEVLEMNRQEKTL